ncbi:MAG: ROK family protein [Paracoccaceae bacterium]|nr:ROK family protein [Paracoccaceae bacterium]
MPAPGETAIGIDAGGSRIRAARVSRSGEVLAHSTEPVLRGREGFSEQVVRLAEAMQDASTRAVGLGIPGRVDGPTGAIRSAGFLDVAGLDVAALLGAVGPWPVAVENDATMALVAEARLRASDTRGLIAMMTIGTGIGGALVADGAPWYGGGLSGQFGHFVVAADGPVCKCGRVGCIETFSSGTAFGDLVRDAGLPFGTRAETLVERAETGDDEARDLLVAWAAPMWRALQSLVAAVDPRLILLGGGLGAEMARALRLTEGNAGWFDRPVEAARLGDAAGVIGAGLRAFDRVAPA